MKHYLEVLLEAVIDTAKILPLLFVVYYLIELIEFKCAVKWKKNKLLQGNASPIVGACMGCVPQCGFSVICTDLFSKNKLSIGALIAVYIATSDEAIPIMIANPSSIGWLFALIGIKLVFGIVIGYVSMGLYKLIFKTPRVVVADKHSHEYSDQSHSEINEHLENDDSKEIEHGGCCHHHVESKTFDWLHPLLHCLKISAFILIINIIFGCITHIWIGEDALINFLDASLYLQPLLAVIIGLIPNCAASVCITELFLMGGLSFGALVAGLCVNAGLGLIILVKQNKNVKENLFIFAMLIIPSLIVGYALNFI